MNPKSVARFEKQAKSWKVRELAAKLFAAIALQPTRAPTEVKNVKTLYLVTDTLRTELCSTRWLVCFPFPEKNKLLLLLLLPEQHLPRCAHFKARLFAEREDSGPLFDSALEVRV